MRTKLQQKSQQLKANNVVNVKQTLHRWSTALHRLQTTRLSAPAVQGLQLRRVQTRQNGAPTQGATSVRGCQVVHRYFIAI